MSVGSSDRASAPSGLLLVIAGVWLVLQTYAAGLPDKLLALMGTASPNVTAPGISNAISKGLPGSGALQLPGTGYSGAPFPGTSGGTSPSGGNVGPGTVVPGGAVQTQTPAQQKSGAGLA